MLGGLPGSGGFTKGAGATPDMVLLMMSGFSSPHRGSLSLPWQAFDDVRVQLAAQGKPVLAVAVDT
jgi:hypothetical protein